MPIEIKELTIKVNVDSGENTESTNSTSSVSSSDPDLIAAIVNQVIEIMKEKQQR